MVDPLIKRYRLPQVANPIEDQDIANKDYVDNRIKTVIKKANQSVQSTTTLVTDTELVLPLLANKVYAGEIHWVISSNSTPDFKYAVKVPAGASAVRYDGIWNSGSPSSTADFTAADVANTDGTEQMMMLAFFVVTVGTADDLEFQFAQNTSNATSTISRIGTLLRLAVSD